MKLDDLIQAMESLAPADTALEFDNVGLLIGTDRSEIRRVLLALDCTPAVADEAVLKDCDLVLTHHPLFFNGVKRILPDAPDTAAAYKLIRHGIGLFAAHTNLDAAEGGVNTALCRLLGIENEVPVPPENIMRVGELKAPTTLFRFAKLVREKLGGAALTAGQDRPVRRVAVLGGSGGGDCAYAAKFGADVYVTGECKHSQGIDAGTMGLAVIAAGHHETENLVIEPLAAYLRSVTDGAEYLISESCTSVFQPR